MADTLYEQDFVVWTEAQAEALLAAARPGSNQPIDYENLAEEIGDLGRSERREVESLARQIMIHLVKLACSPASEPRARWIGEIGEFRDQLERRLAMSPSLRSRIGEIVDREWHRVPRDVGRDFKLRDESSALAALDAWRTRGMTADEVLTDGLHPEPGTTRFVLMAD